jgi:hypothetical protein
MEREVCYNTQSGPLSKYVISTVHNPFQDAVEINPVELLHSREQRYKSAADIALAIQLQQRDAELPKDTKITPEIALDYDLLYEDRQKFCEKVIQYPRESISSPAIPEASRAALEQAKNIIHENIRSVEQSRQLEDMFRRHNEELRNIQQLLNQSLSPTPRRNQATTAAVDVSLSTASNSVTPQRGGLDVDLSSDSSGTTPQRQMHVAGDDVEVSSSSSDQRTPDASTMRRRFIATSQQNASKYGRGDSGRGLGNHGRQGQRGGR